MYKICLLLLSISSPIHAMFGSVMQCTKRLSGAVSAVKFMQSGTLVQQKRMISDSEGRTWYHEAGFESVKSILEKEVGYDFNGLYVTKELTQAERAKILKKIMTRINRGEEYDFYFRTGGVDNGAVWCHSGNDGSRDMQFSELIMKKDWTHGKFIDLVRYFKAVNFIRSEKSDPSVKDLSRAIIQDIMKKYGITEKEVNFVTKAESGSFRIQEETICTK